MIKQFTQGTATDAELFQSIGNWAVSQSVHEQLGVSVTGNSGDLWFISFESDLPVGFAQMRFMKNRTGHFRYLYSESYKAKLDLGNAVIKAAQCAKIKSIFANERRDSPVMQHFEFKQTTDSGKTKFCRWERSFT